MNYTNLEDVLNALKHAIENDDPTVIALDRDSINEASTAKSVKILADCLNADDGNVFCLYGKRNGAGILLRMPSTANDFSDFFDCTVERALNEKEFEFLVRRFQQLLEGVVAKVDACQNNEN